MARRHPMMVSDTADFLQAYRARTASDVVLRELQVEINGWKGQHGLINKRINLNTDDLTEYAKANGVKPLSEAVANVMRCYNNAAPVVVVSSGAGDWSVCVDADIPNLDAACERLKTFFDGFSSNITSRPMFVSGNYGALVSSWTDPMDSVFLRSLKLSYGRNAEIRKRAEDPIGWFEGILENCGFPVGEAIVASDRILQNAGAANRDWRVRARRGSLVVYSPPDVQARVRAYHFKTSGEYSMCATWGVAGTLFGTAANATYTPSEPVYLTQVKSVSKGSYSPNTLVPNHKGMPGSKMGMLGTGTIPKWFYFTVYNGTQTMFDFSGDGGDGSVPTSFPLSHVCLRKSADVAAAVPSLPEEIVAAFPGITSKAKTVGLVNSDTQFDTGWFWARPNGCSGLTFPACAPAFVSGRTAAPDLVKFQPAIFGTKFTMVGVDRYIAALMNDPATSAADKALYAKARTALEPNIDGIIYTTYYAQLYNPPTFSESEKVGLVVKAKDADVDIVNDRIGESGKTLGDAMRRCDNDAKKGKAYTCFSRVIDGVVEQVDLLTASVAAKPIPEKWVLTYTAAGTEEPVWNGVYDGGGTESISSLDAAWLAKNGATIPVAVDDQFFVERHGFTPAALATLTNLPQEGQAAAVGRSSWSSPRRVGELEMSLDAFSTFHGFPVVNFADRDSMIRAMWIYKGFGEDPSGLVSTMFFVNTLDVAD